MGSLIHDAYRSLLPPLVRSVLQEGEIGNVVAFPVGMGPSEGAAIRPADSRSKTSLVAALLCIAKSRWASSASDWKNRSFVTISGLSWLPNSSLRGSSWYTSNKTHSALAPERIKASCCLIAERSEEHTSELQSLR